MSQLVRFGLALLVSTLAACGGKSSATPDDEGHGGTAAGGSGSGGTGTSGSASAGRGHAGSGGTGGANTCTSFDDEAPRSVQVAISNQTKDTIYVGTDTFTCDLVPLFEVADGAGAPLPSLSFCRNACQTLREGTGGCVTICPTPTAVTLKPGEVMYTTWDGLFQTQNQLSSSCVPFDPDSATVSCTQAKRIEPGTFTFSARAGSALPCSTEAGGCRACSASPNGGCETPGTIVTGPMHVAKTTVVLDDKYGVYPSPSASPGPNAGDAELPAPGGAVAVLTVELIFTQ